MQKIPIISCEEQVITSKGQLSFPVPLTSFVGRDQEVTAISALLKRPEIRLLTLIGPGGIGKTRLALQVTAILVPELGDQVCFVSLQDTSDPDLVLPAIARALGMPEQGSQPLLDRFQAFLKEKSLLLLLDNVEQVRDAAPALAALLRSCPGLKILATSRASLRVSGEQTFSVPPLSLPNLTLLPDKEQLLQFSAIALFIERATTILPTFCLTEDNRHLVAQICLHLDGLPLAIELAVPRLKVLSLQTLLERLTHRFAVLTQGMHDAPIRHQTLLNNLEWSYRLLNPREQQLFRFLSVFAGGCTLHALEAAWTLTGQPQELDQLLDDVSSLLEKSMLSRETQGDEEPRLFLLRTIREYGVQRLTFTGEIVQVQWAHATYYLALVEKAEPALKGPQAGRWLEQLQREHENLREALCFLIARGEHEASKGTEMALRLAKALVHLLSIAEALHQTTAIAMKTPIEPDERAQLITSLRDILGEQGFAAAWDQGQVLSLEQTVVARPRATQVIQSPPTKKQPLIRNLPPRSLHDDLTSRERDVLRLVAQGLTDAQVAKRLVLSPRTVNFHLTSIYRKLEVSSRSAATRYAFENQIF